MQAMLYSTLIHSQPAECHHVKCRRKVTSSLAHNFGPNTPNRNKRFTRKGWKVTGCFHEATPSNPTSRGMSIKRAWVNPSNSVTPHMDKLCSAMTSFLFTQRVGKSLNWEDISTCTALTKIFSERWIQHYNLNLSQRVGFFYGNGCYIGMNQF